MEYKMNAQEQENELRADSLAALLQESRPEPTRESRVRVRRTLDRIKTSPWERLAGSRKDKRENTRSMTRLPKRILIPLVAAALLLITGTAVAAGVLLRDNYSPTDYLSETKAEREEKGEAIPDVEAAIASAAPETKAYSITMLPDLPEAELLNEQRQAQGQPAYSEADWGWMRNIKPEIREVLYDGRNCTFTVRLHTDHGMRFDWPREDAGQWVEALMDEARFRREGEDAASKLLVSGGIQSFDETGVTLGFDTRYPASMTFEQLTGPIDERMAAAGFICRERSNSLGHYIAPDTELVSTLMDVYGALSGDRESKPISIGGGTYAREFKNAVAVGVTRPDRPDLCHIANENILLSEMLFNTRFMAECLKRLAAK
jgi:hypothetical protein